MLSFRSRRGGAVAQDATGLQLGGSGREDLLCMDTLTGAFMSLGWLWAVQTTVGNGEAVAAVHEASKS